MTTEHSKAISGSTAERRMHCPASLNLEAGMENVESIYAAKGTACHKAMERILLEDLDPEELLGWVAYTYEDEHGKKTEIKIDQDIIDEKLWPALHAFEEIQDRFGTLEFLVEKKVHLHGVLDDAFGYVDVLGKAGNRRIILDWKFGDGVRVSPEASWQLGFYAAGALLDRTLEAWRDGAKEWVLIVVQPQLDGNDWSSWTTDEMWLKLYLSVLESAWAKAQQPDPPLKLGPWCRWCKAKPVCPAQRQQVVGILNRKTPDGGQDEISMAADAILAEQVMSWAKAVIERRDRFVLQGGQIAGWKVVEGRKSRAWKDEAEAEELLKRFIDDPFTRKLLSPAQAEKRLDSAIVVKHVRPAVEVRPGKPTVAPDTDRRPALVGGDQRLAQKRKK